RRSTSSFQLINETHSHSIFPNFRCRHGFLPLRKNFVGQFEKFHIYQVFSCVITPQNTPPTAPPVSAPSPSPTSACPADSRTGVGFALLSPSTLPSHFP